MIGGIILIILGLVLIFVLGGLIGLILGLILCAIGLIWILPAGGYSRRGWY